MSDICLICQRIEKIKNGANPYFVKELATGYVVLRDHQYFKGYTLFLFKSHVIELHELEIKERDLFMHEMSVVGKAVFRAFNPVKMNYALSGNVDPHLHWHIIPRHKNDPAPTKPIASIDPKIWRSESSIPTLEELEMLKAQLNKELDKLM